MSKLSNDFMQVFHHVDRDGDGKIPSSELQALMNSVGIDLSDQDIEAVVGLDENKLIGLEEFAKLVEMEEGDEEERKARELRKAFKVFEMEGEGCITPESLKATLGRLGAPKDVDECKDMIRGFDVDGDGVLSFEEFELMML